jgi:hypothetical protein
MKHDRCSWHFLDLAVCRILAWVYVRAVWLAQASLLLGCLEMLCYLSCGRQLCSLCLPYWCCQWQLYVGLILMPRRPNYKSAIYGIYSKEPLAHRGRRVGFAVFGVNVYKASESPWLGLFSVVALHGQHRSAILFGWLCCALRASLPADVSDRLAT